MTWTVSSLLTRPAKARLDLRIQSGAGEHDGGQTTAQFTRTGERSSANGTG